MREVIFRAKCTDTGKWFYGGLCITPPPPVCFAGEEGQSKYQMFCEHPHTLADWGMPRRMCLIDVDPATVGQYTGLLDKNGKQVFEGDILRIIALGNDHNQRGAVNELVVKYFGAAFCVGEAWHETGTPLFPLCVDHTMEIIGNIHEAEAAKEGLG